MERIDASTVIYLSPEEIYEFLVDFTQYEHYSKYITEIRRRGTGPPTEYDITFSWWKLTYTARSAVTDVDPPNRIDWELIKDIDARGHWSIEHVPEEAPDGKADASLVRFHVEYHPDSVDESAISLPAFVPLDKVVELVEPKIETVANRIIRRMVADLEGEERPVDLTVHTSSSG